MKMVTASQPPASSSAANPKSAGRVQGSQCLHDYFRAQHWCRTRAAAWVAVRNARSGDLVRDAGTLRLCARAKPLRHLPRESSSGHRAPADKCVRHGDYRANYDAPRTLLSSSKSLGGNGPTLCSSEHVRFDLRSAPQLIPQLCARECFVLPCMTGQSPCPLAIN